LRPLTPGTSRMLGRLARRPNSCSSLTGRLWKAQIRFTSTHVHIPNDLGPTSEDAHGTYRVRSDQKEKDLPLPPLLDPVVLERRSRWENNKARPNAEKFTPFQKKLQANPYGKLPVRSSDAGLKHYSARSRVTSSPMPCNADFASGTPSHHSPCASSPYYQ
jgi:hypothetical protein